MSCSDDFHTLREVVVGRAEHKPVHLHDEPATRKKLTVAGVIALDNSSEDTDVRLQAEQSEAHSASWRREIMNRQPQETLLSDPCQRLKRCSEQVEDFVALLKDNGCKVLRPDVVPGWERPASSPWWQVDKHYGTPCPRDLFVKFGDLLVETYSGWRCRYFEGESYYGVLEEHCERTGSRFVQMPRGTLSDRLYPGYDSAGAAAEHHPHFAFTEHCAILEAADVRRFGKDAFLQVGGYSNRKAFSWLDRLLKKEGVSLHEMTFDAGHTSYYHLDAKFSAVNENTILYAPDPAHKPSKEIFDWFKERDWNLLEAPWREVLVSPEDFTCSGLNLNFLCLAPGKIVLEKGEKGTEKFLREECGCDTLPMSFGSAFEFGGAFNCWTVDLVRE